MSRRTPAASRLAREPVSLYAAHCQLPLANECCQRHLASSERGGRQREGGGGSAVCVWRVESSLSTFHFPLSTFRFPLSTTQRGVALETLSPPRALCGLTDRLTTAAVRSSPRRPPSPAPLLRPTCSRGRQTQLSSDERAAAQSAPLWSMQAASSVHSATLHADSLVSNRASYRLSRLLSTVAMSNSSAAASTVSEADAALTPLTEAQSRALAGTCEEWRANIASVLLTSAAIEAKVRQLAAAISERYAGRRVLCVGLLTGAFVFLADLVRHLTIPYQVDFMVVSSYGQSASTAPHSAHTPTNTQQRTLVCCCLVQCVAWLT